MTRGRVLMMPVDRPPYVTIKSLSLQNMQRIVGGPIEVVKFAGHVVLICNEEGKLRGLPVNPSCPRLNGDQIVGDAFFVRVDGENFAGLTEVQSKILLILTKASYFEHTAGVIL